MCVTILSWDSRGIISNIAVLCSNALELEPNQKYI